MDDDTLRVAFRSHIEGQNYFTRRMAIVLGLMAGVTPMAITLRLERLGLLKAGAWDWFVRNGGITRGQIAEVRASLAANGVSSTPPDRRL